MFSRENTKLTIVAAVCLTAALVAPATAAVYDAVNADKVDGKHAVSAGATVANRKGKLVATDPLTGLPNNIIDTAPNAVNATNAVNAVNAANATNAANAANAAQTPSAPLLPSKLPSPN